MSQHFKTKNKLEIDSIHIGLTLYIHLVLQTYLLLLTRVLLELAFQIMTMVTITD
jgi:hypothetical protein